MTEGEVWHMSVRAEGLCWVAEEGGRWEEEEESRGLQVVMDPVGLLRRQVKSS